MNIKFPLDFLQNKNKLEDTYLAIFLKEKKGIIIFLESKWNRLDFLAKEEFVYTNGWDNITEDIDDTLYKLETQTKKSPEKTIYFIQSYLIDENSREIKRPFLHKIKELSKNLELKPLGYIECHEAAATYLEKKDSIPPTCTLIEVEDSYVSAFVYKSGKVIYKETVNKTEEIVDDLIPIFEKVKHIVMVPTRVVLYDSKNVGAYAEKIVGYKWSPEIFMQLPKVEIISENDLLESLIEVFSSQIITPSTETPKQVEEKPEEKANFGFVIGGDVGARQETGEAIEAPQEVQSIRLNPLSAITATLREFVNKLTTSAKHMGSNMKGVPIPIVAVVGVFFIALAIFLTEFYLHKAQLTVLFPSKKIEKSLIIPASTTAGAKELKLTKSTTTTQFNDARPTTGKKEIGEKAKGTVTIYNSSLSEGKSFAKGTTISSSNSIEFTLNSDIKVASASGDASSITPSIAKTEVTAKEIGPEGNLGGGSKFTIEGESAVAIAKNDSAFTGGVKRTVQTVAKTDADALTKQAVDKAKQFSEKEVKKKLKGSTKVLSNLSKVDLQNPKFSHEVGEEATELSLQSKPLITHFLYDEDNLLNLIKNELKDELNKDSDLPKETIHYSVSKIEEDKGEYTVAFKVDAKQVKSIDRSVIEKVLVGKKDEDLERLLKEKFSASGLELEVNSPLPFFGNRLPFFRKNIDFKVSYL